MPQISGKQLQDTSVPGTKLENGAVDTTQLADGAVETSKIENLNVTAAKLAEPSVTEDKIGTGAVTTDKLGANAVTPGKVDLTDTWDFSSGTLKAGAPSASSDVATKGYTDTVAEGLHTKAACRLATTTTLPAYTPSGSGVGKTLTADANGTLTVDGQLVALGDRVLVKDEATSHVDHGIYECTDAGSGSTPWVLTRATDFDGSPAGEVKAGAYTFISEGTDNDNTGWTLATNDPITVDTTALEFVQFTGAGPIVARDGLTKTGDTLDFDPGDGLEITGGAGSDTPARVKVDATGGSNLARAVNRSANGLAVSVDDESVSEDTSSQLKASVPTVQDKRKTGWSYSQIGSTDYYATNIAITSKPSRDGYPQVMVNGIKASVAPNHASRANYDCYFTDPTGYPWAGGPEPTARNIDAIEAGDYLVWNKDTAGFDLNNDTPPPGGSGDIVDFDYSVL